MKLHQWLEQHLEKPFCQVELKRAEIWCSKKKKANNVKHKKVLAARG